MNANFGKIIPEESLVIDESVIPFRGRLSFRQYLPGKRHKYGIKLFKLTDPKGFTYKIKVYEGKGTNKGEKSMTTGVCMELMDNYLDRGHTHNRQLLHLYGASNGVIRNSSSRYTPKGCHIFSRVN